MDQTSDIQFTARMLLKTRQGEQVTRKEAHRLWEIAEYGHTKGTPVPDNTVMVAAPALPSEPGGI